MNKVAMQSQHVHFWLKKKRTLNDETIKCRSKKTLLGFFINRKS
jgi:hypothetical protein